MHCEIDALTEDGGLACVVEADDDDAHLLGTEQALEQFRKDEAHIYIYIIIINDRVQIGRSI